MSTQFTPTILSPAQVEIARKPTLGGEMRVKLTRQPTLELMTVTVAATNSGVPALNTYDTGQLVTTPMGLIVMAEDSVYGGAQDIVLNFTGTDTNNSPRTGTATFTVPNYSKVPDRVFPSGWSVDIVPDLAGTKWKTINFVGATCAADAVGGRFSVFGMTDLENFVLVGCTEEKDFTTKSQMPENIACGLDESAFVKPGMRPVGTLKVTAKYVSFADGLARFDGATCVALVETLKEGKVTTERLFFINTVFKTKPTAGDGVALAKHDAEGKYEDLAIMVPLGS